MEQPPPTALPPADADQASPQPPPLARAVVFCTRCGGRLVGTDGCPTCTRPVAVAEVVGESSADEAASIRSGVGLYFALLAVSLLLIIWTLAAGRDEDVSVEAEIAASIAISIVTLGWCIPWRASLAPLLKRVGNVVWYALAVVCGAATFIVASLAVAALRHVLKVPTVGYLDGYDAAGYTFATAVLWICVQPAIIEELAFRGVILSSLDRPLTARESSIVTALLFGILHLSVPSLFHLTLLGLLLAWLRRRSGSLWPCMLMHFTHNLLVLLDERNGWLPW